MFIQKRAKRLYVGYNNTSSGIILDSIGEFNNDKAYLVSKNSRDMLLLDYLLRENYYEKIIMLGSKPIMKHRIAVEEVARKDEDEIKTNFNLDFLYDLFDKNLINYKKSHSPGKTNGNKVYYHVLSKVKQNNIDTEVIFIHIPYLDKFPSIEKFIELVKTI